MNGCARAPARPPRRLGPSPPRATASPPITLERISLELTNRCEKACAFCYNASSPSGAAGWDLPDVLKLADDLVRGGARALSFGGGEPLEYEGLFELLARLRGRVFRSITTSGLRLADAGVFEALILAAPDKVHVSLHHPDDLDEVERVLGQVRSLESRGVRSGVNLLVSRRALGAARAASERLRASGVGPERIIYLPLRLSPDAPSAEVRSTSDRNASARALA